MLSNGRLPILAGFRLNKNMLETILLSGAAFILFFITQALWLHWRKPGNRWRAVTRFFWFFLGVYTLVFWMLPFPNWFHLLNPASIFAKWFVWANGAALYILVFLGYAQFYFLIDRSVSARIMVEIEQSPHKRLRIEEIHEYYDPKGMQTRRLRDMLYGGYVVKEGDYYKNTKKGELHARIFCFGKKYLHLYPGG